MKLLPTNWRRLFASPRRRTFRPRLRQLESRLAPAVTLLNNFDGLVSGVPPDTCGAAGPNSYIETVNTSVSIYNKFTNAGIASDGIVHFLYTTGGLTQADANAAPSDVTMCYDEPIGRFIVGTLDVDRGGTNGTPQAPSQFDFAVSKSSTPTALDTANWSFYSFSTTEGSGTSALWSDYPGNLGYNTDALVVTFNMYNSGGTFQHVQINAIPQSSLAAASNVTDTWFDGSSGFGWRPVANHDSASGPMWFVSSASQGGSSITLERVDNILTNPSVHTFSPSGVNSYNAVVNPLNPNGTVIVPLTVGGNPNNGQPDNKIINAAERNNDIVACQAVGVNSNEDDARWYEFDVSNINSPSLVQQGNVSFGAKTYVVYPAIDINPVGDIGMDFTKVGNDTTTDYMSTYITGWKTSDAKGTMETPVLVKAGDSNNTDNRMGDFSGINVDPRDGTFWAADEYTTGKSGATEVANFAMSANFAVNNGQLQIAGDQSGANYNDYIAIDVNPSGSLYAVLNGEANVYGPGQFTTVLIDPRGGTNNIQINNVPANSETDVTGDGVNYVTVGNGYDGVQGINSNVFVFNGYPTPSATGWTSLAIDDSADTVAQTATLSETTYNSGAYVYNEGYISGLAPAKILWFENSPASFIGGVNHLDIYGGSGGDNTFTVTNTGNLSGGTSLYMGAGARNSVSVYATTGALSIMSQAEQDAVTVGSDGGNSDSTMANIKGPLTVRGPGAASMQLNDAGNLNSSTVNMYDGEITGLAPATIYWADYNPNTGGGGVYNLEVDGGSGGSNTFNVYNTSPIATFLYPGIGARNSVSVYATTGALSIMSQAEQDAVTVGSDGGNSDSTMANIKGPLTVRGPGAASMQLNDAGDKTGRTVGMYDGEVTGLAPANIYWTDYNANTGGGGVYDLVVDGGSGGNTFNVYNTIPYDETLDSGTAGDTVNVQATTGSLYIYGSGGAGKVNIGSLAPLYGGTLTGIKGKVTVSAAGSFVLSIDDSGNIVSQNYTLKDGLLTVADPVVIAWTPTSTSTGGVTALNIYGGSGGNTFDILNTSSFYASTYIDTGTGNNIVNMQAPTGALPQAALVINGSHGTNTLVGPDAGSTWNITGTNSGTLAGAAFSGFQDLVGGPGPDIFKFTTTGKVSAINGGGGGDWLDYSAFKATQPVTVNLSTGSATDVGSGAAEAVSNVQNVWGGAGQNTLTGDAQGNVLVGGAASDTITGGTGPSILVGGAGSDTITGHSGNDLLMPGTLSPDLNETALPLMLQEWQRTDILFGQRVADLRHGGGLNGGYKLLYGTTVLNDSGSPDTMTGATGDNWYFQFPGDTVTHATASDVVQSQALPDGMIRRAFTLGGTGYDDSYHVATDAQGNVYVIGDFQGTVNFNPNGTPADLTAAAGPNDAGVDGYLAKYSPTGVLLWVQQFATDANDVAEPSGLTVDAAGNVLVDGWISGSTTFGSVTLPGVTNGSSSGNTAAFVAKLDAAGNVLWAEQLGSTDASTYTFCWNLITDPSANVYVVGAFGGTATIGTTTLTSTGTWDGFVAKLAADGTIQWVKNTAAGSGITEAVAIALDKSGNIYTTGRFAGTGTFGKYSLTSQGGYDTFVTKLNSSGTTLWAHDLGTSGNDYGGAIVVDKSGNVYLAGQIGGDPSSIVSGLVYVARLNSAGTLAWSQQYGTGTDNPDGAESLVVDASGNLYVGGSFEGAIAFGNFNFTSAGQENAFILKLNNAGTVQWAHTQLGLGDNYAGAVLAVDPSLNVYAVGNFEQSMNVDTDPLGTYTLTSAGSYDGFMLELSQRGPLSYTAPASTGPASYSLELNQGYLDLVDNNTGQVVAEKSVDDTTVVQITAAAGVDTTLVLDYGTGTTDVPVTFTGGSGNNTLVGPTQGATWSITAANAGKVGNVTFTHVANLAGGSGADSFKFSANGSLSGSIVGGGGGDTLDYSLWTAAVTVDLTAGTATAVAGGVSGIDNVFGGNGSDTLTGSVAGGLLVGGSGTNVLTAGLGRSILISGSGSSTLLGGPSDDLLIAGTTTYDSNHAALMAILQEWQRPDKTYSQRITDLKKGGGDNGSYKLIWGSTVQDSGAGVDTLTGGAGLDWFFAQLAAGFVDDTITDLNNGGTEQVN